VTPDLTPDLLNMLPESAQGVLVDMRFNLGHKGFRKFKNMIKAVKPKPPLFSEYYGV